MDEPAQSKRILVWVTVGVVLLAVVSLVLASTRSLDLDPDSPEAVVAAFVTAALDGDSVDDFLSGECSSDTPRFRPDDAARVVLLDSSITDDTARVSVRVTHGSSDVFDSYGYSRQEVFDLRHTPDGWRITRYDWPYPGC